MYKVTAANLIRENESLGDFYKRVSGLSTAIAPRSRLNHGPDKRSSRPRPLSSPPVPLARRRRCLHEGTYPPEIPKATTIAAAAPRRAYPHGQERNGMEQNAWNGATSSKFSRDAVINGRGCMYTRGARIRERIKVRIFSSPSPSYPFTPAAGQRHLLGDVAERYRISARLHGRES